MKSKDSVKRVVLTSSVAGLPLLHSCAEVDVPKTGPPVCTLVVSQTSTHPPPTQAAPAIESMERVRLLHGGISVYIFVRSLHWYTCMSCKWATRLEGANQVSLPVMAAARVPNKHILLPSDCFRTVPASHTALLCTRPLCSHQQQQQQHDAAS